MPANVVWAIALIGVLVAASVVLPALVLLPLAAVPVAGMHRMAAVLFRNGNTSFADFVDGMRRTFIPAVATGAAAVGLALLFSANVLLGLQGGGVLGWVFSVLALYADIGLAMMLVTFWPILVDPAREGLPIRRRLAIAALVTVARPGRIFALTFLIGLVLVLSTVLFAALLTISVAYVSLVATRYVLPAADRLEERVGSSSMR